MRSPTVGTGPVSYSKRAHTFRTTDGDRPAARARLGSPTFGNDFTFAAKPNGFVRQHVAERRPARIRHGFRHVGLHQLFGVHVSNENLRKATSDVRRRDVQEMLAPVGDLRRQGAGANRLATLLKQREVSFLGAVVPLRGDLLPGRKRRKVFEPKVNADSFAFAFVGLGQFDLNVDVPAPARVRRKLPGFLRVRFLYFIRATMATRRLRAPLSLPGMNAGVSREDSL